jgi:hypothetical protein
LFVKTRVNGSSCGEGDDGKETKEPFEVESIGCDKAVAEQMQAQIRVGDGARRGVQLYGTGNAGKSHPSKFILAL